MPGRRRGKLLAKIGTFVAFSTAAVGCQSSPLAGALARKATPPVPTAQVVAAKPKQQTAPPPIATNVPPEPEAVPSGGSPGQRDGLSPADTVPASTWRSVERAPTSGIVTASAWLALPEKLDAGNTPMTPTPLQPALEVHAEPSSAEPPILMPPRPLPPASAKPEVAAAVPLVHDPHDLPGAPHGSPADAVPRELSKRSLPTYVVEPPDILLIEVAHTLPKQQVVGQHLVRPDGTISLGLYGTLRVAGLTLDQIRAAIPAVINASPVLDQEKIKETGVKEYEVSVDVLAYNSKVYYIITDGGGYGEAVYRVPVTGSETVLDALAQINGLPAVSSKRHIWIARRTADHPGSNNILPVDWINITQAGSPLTNYQIFPGDRVYVKADKLIAFDTKLGKMLQPIERIFGATLLGATTVNAVRGTNSGR